MIQRCIQHNLLQTCTIRPSQNNCIQHPAQLKQDDRVVIGMETPCNFVVYDVVHNQHPGSMLCVLNLYRISFYQFIGFMSGISDKDPTSRLQYLSSNSERKKSPVTITLAEACMDRLVILKYKFP